MPINARAKGKRGELEVIKLLQPTVQKVYGARGLAVLDLERNLMQSMKGGYDIVGLHWLALEVKRHENITHGVVGGINSWWMQCKSQAAVGQEPVLFYRPNKQLWYVRMYGYLAIGENGGARVRTVVTVDLASFLVWFELRLNHELDKVML